MRATIIDVSCSVSHVLPVLTDIVHDEPSPDKEVFMDDVANWVLARTAVQVDASKPKL